MKTRILLALTLGAPLVVGCGGAAPGELREARSAYQRASQGPAGKLAPADVEAAKQTLAVAERSYDDNGDTQETRDLAYAAQREAQIAEARARTTAALQRRRQALLEAQQIRDQQARTTQEKLSEAQQTLEQQKQALAQEQQARAEAERRAQEAAAQLAHIASVKQEPRGMVITMPGGVLFASGKSDVLPSARSKLSQVADALSKQDKDAKIRVEGYTDSTGSTEKNQELSQKRADAVRDFFVSHGISSDRITAEGFGPSKPVGDNKTPEGRANNRRVEIIVEDQQGQPQQPAGAPSTTHTP